MKELVIGSGNSKKKQLFFKDEGDDYVNPTYLDIDPNCSPDVLWDLNVRPLPLQDEEFDEIHAYEVLEHVGKQGDWKGFLEEWNEYYRILKPGGRIYASCPSTQSVWLWGDPGHTRVINAGTLTFLNQEEYKNQVGNGSMTDYRHWYHGDFAVLHIDDNKERFYFILEKV